ncbi:MAG TPA: hypothetical protein VFV71_09810 [Burkholderiales bacterium]|nr:hypothetical protein [Burkholderiales bacterium]
MPPRNARSVHAARLEEFPRISRQKYPDLVKRLKDFRDGNRSSDIMAPTAKNLTDERTGALAQYLTGL